MQKKKTHLTGFTLIETLIAIVIIGILAVVLCESYITISKTSFRVEQEKNLSEESLILTQVLQTIADESSIDYSKYENLKSNNGFTNTLYLTGDMRSGASIYTTGNCAPLTGIENIEEFNGMSDYADCNLILEQGNNKTNLTSSLKVIPSNVIFRIIPYNNDDGYFSSDEGNVINDVHQQAFWIFIRLYSYSYNPSPNQTNHIDLPLQLFFNLNA